MTESELYKKIKSLLEGWTEGLYWDFKKTLTDTADIIKDIMAFSNSEHEGDSYIIVGVSESKSQEPLTKIPLSSEDRRRLETDANFLYFPGKWKIHGLNAEDITAMKQFSAKLSEQIAAYMLISQPRCEYMPLQIGPSRWLYVIIIKNTPGVFIAKKDISHAYDSKKVAVKQGVLYIRKADMTIGARTDVASATEHIRIWKRYIDWLSKLEDNPNEQTD